MQANLYPVNIMEHAEPVHESNESTSDKKAAEFAIELEALGIRPHVLEAEHNPLPEYLESLTLVDRPVSDEQTVRLYRGVSPKSGYELAHQVCYLLKKPIYREGSLGLVTHSELESQAAFDAVEEFVKRPSYRAMKDMVTATNMSEGDQRFVHDRIKSIQLEMLRDPNATIVSELRFNHVAAPAGVSSQDLSPFIATSQSPHKAAVHGDTLMVLDVPVSKLAGIGEVDEMLLPSGIDPSWISAVARFKKKPASLEERGVQDVLNILEGIPSEGSEPVIPVDTIMQQASKKNRLQDVEDINEDLINELATIDPEAIGKLLAEMGITKYQDALWACAEYYQRKRGELFGRSNFPSARDIYDIDEVQPPIFRDLNEPRLRVLDADAIDHLAQAYYHQKSKYELATN